MSHSYTDLHLYETVEIHTAVLDILLEAVLINLIETIRQYATYLKENENWNKEIIESALEFLLEYTDPTPEMKKALEIPELNLCMCKTAKGSLALVHQLGSLFGQEVISILSKNNTLLTLFEKRMFD